MQDRAPCKKVPLLPINRFMGDRDGTYQLIVFTDASKHACGCVIYLKHVNSGRVSFLSASNKLLSVDLRTKTMPSLELLGISLGLERMLSIYAELCGSEVVQPTNIADLFVFSDSMACLAWVASYAHESSGQRHQSIFVRNLLKKYLTVVLRLKLHSGTLWVTPIHQMRQLRL